MSAVDLKLSVVIPCFNEEEVIGHTYQRISAVFNAGWIRDYELIFINDGSRDKTLFHLKEMSLRDAKVKILSFSRNFGHQAAVAAGLKNSSGDIAIIIDADLQDPPELFPEMVQVYIKEQCNVVYGVRKSRQGETWFKKWTAKAFYRFLNYISEVNLYVDTGDFRLVDRKVIDCFNGLKEKNKYIRGLISWMGFQQVPFMYDRQAREYGETKYPLRKMLRFASIAMFYFSKKPLKLALFLGFVSILIGLVLGISAVIAYYSPNSQTTPGWASLIISVIFFGGVQLTTLGVLGEYIGNIFDEVKDRPEYIIDHKINF